MHKYTKEINILSDVWLCWVLDMQRISTTAKDVSLRSFTLVCSTFVTNLEYIPSSHCDVLRHNSRLLRFLSHKGENQSQEYFGHEAWAVNSRLRCTLGNFTAILRTTRNICFYWYWSRRHKNKWANYSSINDWKMYIQIYKITIDLYKYHTRISVWRPLSAVYK